MEILTALLDLLTALSLLIWAIVQTVLPWTPLIAWIAFWTLAVDWVKLRSFMLSGGWIGVLLLALVAVLVWGVVAPPPTGVHSLLGLSVSNFVGKIVYVTTLVVIMLLCGSVQLSGVVDCCLNLQPATAPGGPDDHADGHDDAGHGHSHGHEAPALAHHGGH